MGYTTTELAQRAMKSETVARAPSKETLATETQRALARLTGVVARLTAIADALVGEPPHTGLSAARDRYPAGGLFGEVGDMLNAMQHQLDLAEDVLTRLQNHVP